jgi:hypothetical protein
MLGDAGQTLAWRGRAEAGHSGARASPRAFEARHGVAMLGMARPVMAWHGPPLLSWPGEAEHGSAIQG